MKKLLILFLLLFTLTACSPENTGTPTPTQYFYDLAFRENISYDLENGTPIYTDYMSTARQKISRGGLFIRNADLSPDVNAHHVLFWSKNNYYLGYQNFDTTTYQNARYLGDISTIEIVLPEHADKFSIIASKMSVSELIPHEATINSNVGNLSISYTEMFSTIGNEQLLTNGDFSDGTTGWNAFRGPGVVNNKVYTLTGNTTDEFMAIFRDQTVNTTDIFYLYGYLMTPNTVSNIRITGDIDTSIVLATPIVNQWYFLSGIKTYINIRGRHQFQLNNTSINTNVLNVKNTGRINISTLIENKQYSPLYDTTFDLMSNTQIKLQMDDWISDDYLPSLAQIEHETNLTKEQVLYHYHTYLRLLEKTDVTLEEIGTYVPTPYDNTNLTLPFDYNAYGETYNDNTNGVEYIDGAYYYAQYFTKYDRNTLMKEFNYHSFDDIFKNNNYLDPNNVDDITSYSTLISVTEQDNGFYRYIFNRVDVGTPYPTYAFFIEIHNLEYEPVPFPTLDTHNVFLIAKWNSLYITDTLGDLKIQVQAFAPPTIQIDGTGGLSTDEDFFPTEYHTLFYNQTSFDPSVRQINVTYSEAELINNIHHRNVSLDMYMFYGPYFDLYNLQEEDVNEWWSIYQDVLANDIVYVELDEPIYTPIEEFTALNIERLIGYHQDLVLEEELTEEELIPLAFASGEDLDPLFMNAGIGGFANYIYLTSNEKSDYITLWDNVSYNYLHYTTFLKSTYEYVVDLISRYELIDSYTELNYTEFQETESYYILDVYPPTPSNTSGFLNDQLEEWGLNTSLFKTLMIVIFMIVTSIILAIFGAKQSILILANALILILFAILGWVSMWLFIPIVLIAGTFIVLKFTNSGGGTEV